MDARLAEVVDFIKRKHPELTEVDPDIDLVETRLVDSLSFVEFVFLIQHLSGEQIDLDSIDLADFRTLNRIDKRFFATG